MGRMHLPFLLYYSICNIYCSDLNGSVDCTDGDGRGDSFGFNKMLSFIIQNKT